MAESADAKKELNPLLQQLVQQLVAPLTEAAKTFSAVVAESLTKEMEKTTKAFKEAHPAIAKVNSEIIGWSSVVAEATGSVATMTGNARDMIRNTRELRQEITDVLDSTRALDGVRLRFMFAGDAIKRFASSAKSNAFDAVRQGATRAAEGIGRFTSGARSMATTAAGGARNLIQLAAGYARTAVGAALAAVRTVAMALAQRVAAIATRAWAIVQGLLNVVMSLNPIGLVIAAIALLVGAIVLAYKRSATFRSIVQAAFTAVKNVVVNAINVIRNVVAVVWPYIAGVIRIAVTIIRAYITVYFTAIRLIITAVWIVIRAVISGAVTAVVHTIQGIGRVVGIVRDAFNRARSAVGNAISGVVDFVHKLPGRVIATLGNLGQTLYSKGRDLITGFINGIRDMAGHIVSAIKDFIIDKIPGPIQRALGMHSPSRLMAEIGRNIGEGLVVGIDASGDRVSRAMARLIPTPRSATIRPAVAALATATAAKASAGPAGARDGRPVTVNVYPRAGQSEQEIGRVAAREIAWAAKRS